MAKRAAAPSAGILLWRRDAGGVSVLLAHFGGPYWKSKDVWSIPKGEYGPDEDPLAAARREFCEETGHELPAAAPAVSLGELRQTGGKRVTVYAIRGDFDVATLVSNTFAIEWPPRSGRRETFPEIDRAAWFTLAEARTKMLRSQRPFLDRLAALAGEGG